MFWLSSVADITSNFRSGLRLAWASRGQGQTQIGLQAALVKLIEDDEPTPSSAASCCNMRVKHAFGDHLNGAYPADTRVSMRMR